MTKANKQTTATKPNNNINCKRKTQKASWTGSGKKLVCHNTFEVSKNGPEDGRIHM